MGIVKGFGDIIAPQNLATNGSFRINQRGLFSSWTEAQYLDFVSDAWRISGVTVDFIECQNTTSYGKLYLRGYGKKGQHINIQNKDYANPIASTSPKGTIPAITASVAVACTTTSVPLKVLASPRYRSGDTQSYIKYAEVNSRKTSDSSVRVISLLGNPLGVNIAPYITVELMADGEFSLSLGSFQELCGAFINPPEYAMLPYADDLLRCKRYYQKLYIAETLLPKPNSGGLATFCDKSLFLHPEMAGTPTVATTGNIGLIEGGSGSDISANVSVYFDNTFLRSTRLKLSSSTAYDSIRFTGSVAFEV